MGDRRADSVNFGFDFQTNAAIVLMLDNIKKLNSLRIEGESEDIEIELNNGELILAQAKSVVKSSTDFKNVRKNLKKAIETLSEAAAKVNVKQLIFVTNSPNPLNDKKTMSVFYGHTRRKFSSLPDSSKNIINGYLENLEKPLDTNKFMIQVIPFETDDEQERYKVIKQCVDDFVGKIHINISGVGNRLLEIWQNDVFQNASKHDVNIKLSKKDIIWPLIVIITDINLCHDTFAEQFDMSLYDEITHTYSNLINSCCERFEFFTKVLYDFNEFKSSKSQMEKCVDFVLTQWENYLDELKIQINNKEIQKGLIQIVLYNIVKNRLKIGNVKKEVNL